MVAPDVEIADGLGSIIISSEDGELDGMYIRCILLQFMLYTSPLLYCTVLYQGSCHSGKLRGFNFAQGKIRGFSVYSGDFSSNWEVNL